MESLSFWLEGIWLWIDERRRGAGIVAALAAMLATMVLLGSTIAAPLFTSETRQAGPVTASAPKSPSQGAGGRRHYHAHHGTHSGNGGRSPGGPQRAHATRQNEGSRRHQRQGGGGTPGREFAPP